MVGKSLHIDAELKDFPVVRDNKLHQKIKIIDVKWPLKGAEDKKRDEVAIGHFEILVDWRAFDETDKNGLKIF